MGVHVTGSMVIAAKKEQVVPEKAFVGEHLTWS
jgi:hypothetical protein